MSDEYVNHYRGALHRAPASGQEARYEPDIEREVIGRGLHSPRAYIGGSASEQDVGSNELSMIYQELVDLNMRLADSADYAHQLANRVVGEPQNQEAVGQAGRGNVVSSAGIVGAIGEQVAEIHRRLSTMQEQIHRFDRL